MSSRYYAERVVGAYPISIATSLAIEGGLGMHPDHPTNKNELKGEQVIYINVKTVFRNFHNAMNKDDVGKCNPQEWAEELLLEMERIAEIFTTVTDGVLIVQYYLSDYLDLNKKYKHAIIRTDTTPLQIEYTKRMTAVISALLKMKSIDIKIYPFLIAEPEQRRTLILTHVAPDLFTKTIPNKKLLESHTGAVKSQSQWYTKYINGKGLANIPFRLDLVQIFGDNELFRPWNIKAKQEILNIADKYNWSQVTSTAKIRYSFEQIRDHLLRRTLLDMIES